MTQPPLAAPPLPRTLAVADGGAAVVETTDLTLAFGRRAALDHVDLIVPEGSVYLLAGANGAGKTTLLGTLLNYRRSYRGAVRVFGMDPRRHGPMCRANIGYVPEGSEGIYRWSTAGQLIESHASYFPTWDADYAKRLGRILEITPKSRMNQMSKGQARRVQLLMAMAHRPPLLLLDEPTDGLDPVVRDEVLGLLSEHIADTGCTIIVSTHLLFELDRMADYVGILKQGTLVTQLSRQALEQQLRVYTADGPDGWTGPGDLSGVLKQARLGRQIQWTVWGDPADVRNRIERSGGSVRDVVTPPFTDAVVALMRAEIRK